MRSSTNISPAVKSDEQLEEATKERSDLSGRRQLSAGLRLLLLVH